MSVFRSVPMHLSEGGGEFETVRCLRSYLPQIFSHEVTARPMECQKPSLGELDGRRINVNYAHWNLEEDDPD